MDDTDDFEAHVTAEDAGAGLGRRRRTHRQRRRSTAPRVWTIVGAVLAILIGVIAQDARIGARAALIVVPVGFLIGFLSDYFAPRRGPHGRLWLTVHEDGVVIDTQHGGAEPITPVRLAAPDGPERLTADTPDVSLVWPQEDEDEPILVPLDSFSAPTAVRRALIDHEYTGERWLARTGVAAVAIAVFTTGWLVLAPADRPENSDDFDLFCDDPRLTFSDSPRYNADGPADMWVTSDRPDAALYRADGVQESRDVLADRGWGGWFGEDTEFALAACGTVTTGSMADDCAYSYAASLALPYPYGGNQSADKLVPVYLMTYEFTIYRLADHSVVGTARLSDVMPDDWECPERITENKSRIDVHASPEQIAEALIAAATG